MKASSRAREPTVTCGSGAGKEPTDIFSITESILPSATTLSDLPSSSPVIGCLMLSPSL
ncbi:MAG: hypothetical protein M0D55_01040 [Elusimicrobiota bacterium]|nr:MAG: hypothetical protein M0D55_01040 [Elusimicrobiota bacterium]